MTTSRHMIARLARVTAFAAVTTNISVAAAQNDWLSLCGKCLSPSVTSKSGIGTAQARAEGRITRGDAEGWCQNWEPQTPIQQCVRLQLSSDDAKRTYRATADCAAGKITPIDGASYTLAGKWTSDVGRGRSRWRDAEGWCQNWEPQTPLQQCVRLQLSSDDAKRTYRATADCTSGKITAIDGASYTLAGKCAVRRPALPTWPAYG